eukprot:COSAG02_NODE_6529_length_3517_cov_89.205676_4_plen_609_part_00
MVWEMSYDPDGTAPLVVTPAEEEEEDEPPPPVLPRPKSPRTMEACLKVGVSVEELEYRDLPFFEKPKFGENYVLEEVAFSRYRAAESMRLMKLEQVLEARKELLKPKETGKSALVLAAENSVKEALQREVEKQAQFKQQQQRKAEKEVRQVLLLQASAAEMAEKNRIRQEKEAQRALEIEEEAKRQREEFNRRKQEMERLKIEDERARNQKLREEQLVRLEKEKIRLAKEEQERKQRAKEIVIKQQQKAERQREHKAMIEAKEKQREMAAEKRLTQMAAKDLMRREAQELAQEEVARRNAELKEYQSLRMHSIREFQEKQIAEQRGAFVVRQEIAAEKLAVMEERKEKERIAAKIREKEKEKERAKVFDQMKEVAEERRQSFLEIMTVKERKIELVEKKLKREREVKREQLRLIAAAKEDRVQRSKKADAYTRSIMQLKLEENEEKQREIKANKEYMLKERKRMQRQSQIERAQMKESLERLKTYGGRPDDALMALIGGDDLLTNSASQDDVDNSSSPVDETARQIQDGRVGQSLQAQSSLPDISARPGSREAEGGMSDSQNQGDGDGGMYSFAQQELSAIDMHLIRLEDLRRQQNEELLVRPTQPFC